MCYTYSDFIKIKRWTAKKKKNWLLRKVTPGTRSGSPQLHSSSEYGSQEEKTCPNHYPRDRWEVDTKNYFILLWGPFYTHSSFLHVFGSLCCNSSLSPNRSVHFPHLSEGSDRSKYMMYWEMTGSFHGLHVLRVTGPEDPWFLQVPDYNTCPRSPNSLKTTLPH